MSEGPGSFYLKLCQLLGGSTPSPSKDKEIIGEIRHLEAAIQEDKKRSRNFELSGMAREFSRIQKDIGRKSARLAKLKRIHQQKDFTRAMRITGMGLSVGQVIRFGYVAAFMAMLMTIIVSVIIGLMTGMEFFMLIIIAFGAGVSVPLAVFLFIVNYPERLAKELELEAFGSAPEIVNYMVMSMELNPSIDKALEFAAENAEGPMAREMKALVWKIQTRQYASTEEALADYAMELEGVNEEMRSALYNILSASKESDRETMRSCLTRASDIVLTGTRQRVEDFSASLGTPTTVLFALGVLLPMIIGSMLPMISLGDFGIMEEQGDQGNWVITLLMSILVMNVLFPAFAFIYSRNIIGRRPGIHTISLLESSPGFRRRFPGALAMFITFSILSWFLGIGIAFWDLQWSLAALMVLAGTAVSTGYVLASDGSSRYRLRNLEKLEDQIPDMLFQIGSRITEGMALERALDDVSHSMEGTEIGAFLADLVGRLERSGLGLEELLFSEGEGILLRHPSRKLKAEMRLMVEASGKNPATAGSVLMSMSNHMRELANTDRDMRNKLKATIDSMKNTAMFFAPVIMGVTVGLYRLLSDTFGDLSSAEIMPVPYFILIMGAYLLTTVGIIITFCSGIEKGRGRWKGDVAIALPVSAIVYSVAALGALLAFG